MAFNGRTWGLSHTSTCYSACSHTHTETPQESLLPALFIVLKMWCIKMLIFGFSFQEFFCPFVPELATPLQDTSI